MTNWALQPDVTSVFLVADSAWQFGASSNASPVSFVVPNRDGVTIHVSGRAANVWDQECSFGLSPLTRWRISGSAGDTVDSDVPGVPTFGLSATGQGSVEISAIGFSSLDNTLTISAGTLTLAYWDEVNPQLIMQTVALAAADTVLTLATPTSVQVGDFIQIESEIVAVQTAVNNSASISVTRGAVGTSAAAHGPQTPLYFLAKKTFVMAFAPDFFGSPASGSYAFPVSIPDVRIGAAEMFVTNAQGNSPVAAQSFTSTTDRGLRTLSGGQLCIQVEGPLAIQTNAAPFLIMDSAHSVRDIYAVVQQAAVNAPILLQVTQNGQPYCQLTIPASATISNTVDGFALGPLALDAQIGLDILSVVQDTSVPPGSDLTVTIRL